MSSRLVLGGATYGKLSQTEVNRLLETGLDMGIKMIDTAHGYENSEKRIGSFLKHRNQYVVNTKVGLPDPSNFTPSGIKLSVENSLRRLGVEKIGTLFIHSLSPEHLNTENIQMMVSLKDQGKVEKIGYAGDGFNLGFARQIAAFDDFAVTFNIIDQSNATQMQTIEKRMGVYFKLAMAQAIWTSENWSSRFRSNIFIRRLARKPPVPGSWIDYRMRFNELKSEIDNKNFANSFLGFALFSGTSEQYVILGTNNYKHILDAAKVENYSTDQQKYHAKRYEELWARKASPNWEAHNG